MPRYVDADKVMETFCENCISKRDWFCNSFCDIKEKIDNVPTEEVRNDDDKWISVEDRLPDSNRYCWVTLKSGEVAITWYDPYEPEWDQLGSSIVAWMYVEGKPKPYKPVKKKSIKSVEVSEHNCCDCDHYRGKIDGTTYCKFYGKFYGSELGSCDAWEEIEDR